MTTEVFLQLQAYGIYHKLVGREVCIFGKLSRTQVITLKYICNQHYCQNEMDRIMEQCPTYFVQITFGTKAFHLLLCLYELMNVTATRFFPSFVLYGDVSGNGPQ